MGLTRLYHADLLSGDTQVTLSKEQSHHLLHVMRLRIGENCVVFNGEGLQCHAILHGIQKKQALLQIIDWFEERVESPLQIHLMQAISKSDKMDYTIQKAVELGVACITPVITSRSVVNKSTVQLEKKMRHWQQIAIHAAEQSGRVIVPKIHTAVAWQAALSSCCADWKAICIPGCEHDMDQGMLQPTSVLIAIGPEGGFSEQEALDAQQNDFSYLRMGPRILRTETAAVVALTLLQKMWGDI